MNPSVLLWLLGAIVFGALVLVWGLRGKRLNSHPVCRQCRFDLSGQPEGTITCPECGAGLKREGSIRIGQRRKRPFAIGLGCLAIILPLLMIGTIVFALVSGQDLNTYKPIGLLSWEARRAGAAQSKLIAAELHRRIQNKAIDPGSYDRIVQAALAYQEDEQRPWATEWGDIIEQADVEGKLSKDDLGRYRRQAAVLQFDARPRVSSTDSVPVLVTLKEARIGSAAALWGTCLLDSLKIGTQAATRAPRSIPGMDVDLAWPGLHRVESSPQLGFFQAYGPKNTMGWQSSFGHAGLLAHIPKGTNPGPTRVDLTVGLKLVEQARGSYQWPSSMKNDPGFRKYSGSVPVEILAPGLTSVEVVSPDPELEKKLRTLLEPSGGTAYSFAHNQGMQVSFIVNISGRPIDFAFDVVMKADGKQWKLSPLTSGRLPQDQLYQPQSQDTSRQVYGDARGLKSSTVEIILKPSELLAAQTIETTRIYGGEIVFKDVEVQIQNGTGGATPASGKSGGLSDVLKLFGL